MLPGALLNLARNMVGARWDSLEGQVWPLGHRLLVPPFLLKRRKHFLEISIPRWRLRHSIGLCQPLEVCWRQLCFEVTFRPVANISEDTIEKLHVKSYLWYVLGLNWISQSLEQNTWFPTCPKRKDAGEWWILTESFPLYSCREIFYKVIMPEQVFYSFQWNK